jgi:hypothetical protein
MAISVSRYTPLLLSLLSLCGWLSASQAQQICDPSIPSSAPDSRFTLRDDGTVLDQNTGLIWKQCAEGQSGPSCEGTAELYNWGDALQTAESSNFAGSDGWRLPNVKELQSLLEQQCNYPAINEAVFPNTPSDTVAAMFWSASPYAWPYQADFAWHVSFSDNNVGSDDKSREKAVRLVRSQD